MLLLNEARLLLLLAWPLTGKSESNDANKHQETLQLNALPVQNQWIISASVCQPKRSNNVARTGAIASEGQQLA